MMHFPFMYLIRCVDTFIKSGVYCIHCFIYRIRCLLHIMIRFYLVYNVARSGSLREIGLSLYIWFALLARFIPALCLTTYFWVSLCQWFYAYAYHLKLYCDVAFPSSVLFVVSIRLVRLCLLIFYDSLVKIVFRYHLLLSGSFILSGCNSI